MDNKEKALKCHEEWNGKLETIAKSKVNSREDLAIAYTPGVAEPCKVIAKDKELAYKYCCCCFRRQCRPWSRKYRSICSNACYGGKMCTFQRIW